MKKYLLSVIMGVLLIAPIGYAQNGPTTEGMAADSAKAALAKRNADNQDTAWMFDMSEVDVPSGKPAPVATKPVASVQVSKPATPAARNLPAPVNARITEMTALCREGGGRPDASHAVTARDLNHDGLTDFVFWEGDFGCVGAEELFEPTAATGLPAVFYTGKKASAPVKAWAEDNVWGVSFSDKGLLVAVGGVACGDSPANKSVSEMKRCQRQVSLQGGRWVLAGQIQAAAPALAPFPTLQERAFLDVVTSCRTPVGKSLDRAELYNKVDNRLFFFRIPPTTTPGLLPVNTIIVDRNPGTVTPATIIVMAQMDAATAKTYVETAFDVERNSKGPKWKNSKRGGVQPTSLLGLAGIKNGDRYQNIWYEAFKPDSAMASTFLYADVYENGLLWIACSEPEDNLPSVVTQARMSTPPGNAVSTPPPSQRTAWGYGDTHPLVQPGGGCPDDAQLLKGYCFANEIAYLRSHPRENMRRVIAVTAPVGVGAFVGKNAAVGAFWVEVKRDGDGFRAEKKWQGTTRAQPPQGCLYNGVADQGYRITSAGALEGTLFVCDPNFGP